LVDHLPASAEGSANSGRSDRLPVTDYRIIPDWSIICHLRLKGRLIREVTINSTKKKLPATPEKVGTTNSTLKKLTATLVKTGTIYSNPGEDQKLWWTIVYDIKLMPHLQQSQATLASNKRFVVAKATSNTPTPSCIKLV